MKTPCRSWVAAGLALFVSVCGEARADIPPPPVRPGWKDHAPPEPDVPLNDLARALGALSVVAAGASAIAWKARAQRRAEPSRA